MGRQVFQHRGYSVRHWEADDRDSAADVVRQCLESYGLNFEPRGADLDAIEVEAHYLRDDRGEFWVVIDEAAGKLIGTAGYYEMEDKDNEELKCAEIRKMYLLPEARGKKLGRALLQRLEEVIASKGYHRIIVETATVLHEACRLYETSGYKPVEGVETQRCDKRLYKNIAGVST